MTGAAKRTAAPLSQARAVSERKLRKALQKIYGLPPCRRLRLSKVSRARQPLMSGGSSSVTVPDIATGIGFVELGRLSVEYQEMFGERPSKALFQRYTASNRRTETSPWRRTAQTAARSRAGCGAPVARRFCIVAS
jgi:transcriptional regulator GlxA family with amidase domain